MKDYIQLGNTDLVKIGIKDAEGNDTGEFLTFDLGDIELPLKLNKCEMEHRKNINYVKMQFVIIDKKEDKKGKYILSSNEEEKVKVMLEFYKKEMEALDLFLGQGGTKKLLNGRNPYWEMYDDINTILEPVLPILKKTIDGITDRIKSKYSTKNEEDVLK